MTPAQTISARNKQKKETLLQERAERLLDTLTQSSRVSKAPMGSNPVTVEDKAPVPDANAFIPNKAKVDKLALAADKVIKEIQGV